MKNSKGLIQRLSIPKEERILAKVSQERFLKIFQKISKLKYALFSKAHFQKEIYLLMFYSGIFLQFCLFSCLKQLSER